MPTDGASRSPAALETAEYAAEILAELGTLAKANRLPVLAYFIEMAALQAQADIAECGERASARRVSGS